MYDSSFMESPSMAAPCRSRPAEQVTVCWEQRRCHSLTPTTARRRPRLHWRRGAFAVMDARPARREGLLAGARLRAVGGVAFEGAAGGLVNAGGGVDHRPPDSGPQEPVDGLQPAFLAGSSTRLPAPSSRPSTVVAVHAHRYVRQQQTIRYYRAAAPVSASSCCQGGGWVSGLLSTPDTGTGLIAPGSLL